jgi:hypothetical protein
MRLSTTPCPLRDLIEERHLAGKWLDIVLAQVWVMGLEGVEEFGLPGEITDMTMMTTMATMTTMTKTKRRR